MTSGNLNQKEILNNLAIDALNPMQLAFDHAYTLGKDIVLLSPTGSGKTIGFLMPLLQILKPNHKGIQAVVLAPSRELALQIEDVFKKMKTGFKVNCCYGGHSVKIEINNLSEPPSVLIGTPGRVDDLLKRKILDFNKVNTLIIDEFDKSLELGFQDEIRTAISNMPQLKQRVLTSATRLEEIPSFVGMRQATQLDFLDPNGYSTRLTIKKIVIEARQDKIASLFGLISSIGDQAILVFVNLRESVEHLSNYLFKMGIPNGVYHGGLEQLDRERALVKFRNGSVKVLVTTDLAARGLDIPEIRAVIHYQLPLKEEEFIHRNGRTARMHASGEAFVLFDKGEQMPDYVYDLDIPVVELPPTSKAVHKPEWETLYIGKGKKDKVNKVDIVGFLCQKGMLDKLDIGLIEVKDSFAYVAVRRSKVQELIKKVRDEKLKNYKTKIEIAR